MSAWIFLFALTLALMIYGSAMMGRGLPKRRAPKRGDNTTSSLLRAVHRTERTILFGKEPHEH